MKAEDKFYFQQSKFVVCVLFGDRCVFQNAYATLSQAQSEAKKAHAKYGQVGNEYLPTAKGTVEIREYQGSNLISQHKFSRPGQPERFAEIKDRDLYPLHDAINKRAIAANKNEQSALADKYESWMEMIQDMIALARDGKKDRLKQYARGLPSELRNMLPQSISFARGRSRGPMTVELDFSDAPPQAETSKNDYMAEMLKQAEISLQTMTKAQGRYLTAKRFLQHAEAFLHSKTPSALRDKLNRLKQMSNALPEAKPSFSRPGQPERFDANWGPRESTKERARSFKNLLQMDGIYAYHEDGVVFVDEKNLQKAKQRQRSEQYYRNVKVKGVAGYDEGRPDTFAASDDRASDFLRRMSVGVTPSNIQQMQIRASQALAYGQGRNDRMLIDKAKALQSEIIALKKAGH